MAEKKKRVFKKWQLILLGILGVSFVVLQILNWQMPEINLLLKNQKLHLMVANNIARQYKGLGGRDNLGNYDGMLFVFNNYARQAFVMRDMRFPIDIIWFNKGKVVDFASNVQSEPGKAEGELMVYEPRMDANMVLEMRAGWALKNGLKIGDQLYTDK